jgi:hypothetical protein
LIFDIFIDLSPFISTEINSKEPLKFTSAHYAQRRTKRGHNKKNIC